MEVTVANAYPKRRNCRQNAPLNTPKHAANTMVAKPLQFDDRGQEFEQPQVRKRQASDTSVARPEEHVFVRPQHIQQTLVPASALPPERSQVRWHFRPAHRVRDKFEAVVRALIQ